MATKSVDEHTVFLLTDSLIDQSKNHIPVLPIGTIGESCCSNMSADMRDDRNCILLGSKTCLSLGQAHVLDGTKDWTVECWRFVISNTSNGAIFSQRLTYGSPYGGILIGHSAVSPHCGLYISNNTSSWDVVNGGNIGSSSMPLNSWHHMAVCKSGNNYLCFVDGVLKNTITGSTAFTQTTFRTCLIGGYSSGNTPQSISVISGYLQDFRISDICRYTANFTPPVAL